LTSYSHLTSKLSLAIVTACLLVAQPTAAQTDNKPIKLLVGFPPGGSADQIARLLAEKIQISLGNAVLVENRPGAAGRLAIEALIKSPADGKTFIVMPSGPVVVFPHVFRKLSYDPVKDLTPISLLARFSFAIASGKSTDANTVKDLVAKAKSDPKTATYGTPGAGTLPHFLGVMIADAAKIDLVHAPFQGGAPAQVALLGGHVGYAIDVASEYLEFYRSGKVKLVATTGAKRSPLLPDVPTLLEQGVPMSASAWFAMYGPAGLAPEQVKRVNAAVVAAVNERSLRARIIALGNEPVGSSAAELAAIQKADFAQWEKPIKATGFKLD
jgi:tripartite-type tricarboxylate transporter receptor subunit TctC